MPGEPIGYLSAVFPGPVLYGTNAAASRVAQHTSSRVCEQVWLEPSLFLIKPGGSIYACVEENYTKLRHSLGQNDPAIENPIFPGALGEQLLFRELAQDTLTAGLQFTIADSKLEVTLVTLIAAVPQALADFPIIQLRILEPGLVEPGAPLIVANP